ncbi:MAG TPA: methyltransferase domain-containing protein [Puia sp.]
MAISEIQYSLRAIESNRTVYEAANFDGRADTIDFIEFHILHRLEGLLQQTGPISELMQLQQQAEQAKNNLERIDSSMFHQLREEIKEGRYRGAAFLKLLHSYVRDTMETAGRSDNPGYDNLDVFVNGLLTNDAIPAVQIRHDPEMVFYQKTPVRIILEMCAQGEFKAEDVFFDIGSGLGQAVLLVHLLCGVSARGIEYEPAYCKYAQNSASKLKLKNVTFIQADARGIDYSEGTIFFMYTPFEGAMLQEMLDKLQNEAQKRAIRIFTYGPCSATVARQSWLRLIKGNTACPDQLCQYTSQSHPPLHSAATLRHAPSIHYPHNSNTRKTHSPT